MKLTEQQIVFIEAIKQKNAEYREYERPKYALGDLRAAKREEKNAYMSFDMFTPERVEDEMLDYLTGVMEEYYDDYLTMYELERDSLNRFAFVLKAVAGSGKTSTLLEAAKYMEGRILAMTFGKATADEMQAKFQKHGIANGESRTMHSIGLEMVKRWMSETYGRYVKVDGKKDMWSVKDAAKEMRITLAKFQTSMFESVIAHLRNANVKPGDKAMIRRVAELYGVKDAASITIIVSAYLKSLQKTRDGKINFDEMITIPYYENLKPDSSYDDIRWMIVDEMQDWNPMMIDMALKFKCYGLIMAGDPQQSIYGFMGSSPELFANTLMTTEAEVFPLTYTFRCPTSHVQIAQEYVPEIEAPAGAPVGSVEYVNVDYMAMLVQPDDLLYARTNSELIRIAPTMLRAGHKYGLKREEYVWMIAHHLNNVRRMMGGRFYSQLQEILEQYRKSEIENLRKAEAPQPYILRVAEIIDMIRAAHEGFTDIHTIDELQSLLEDILGNQNVDIEGRTVHRVKGAEAERCWYINDGRPWSREGQTPKDIEEERRIQYVAVTRSKSKLMFVDLNKDKANE